MDIRNKMEELKTPYEEEKKEAGSARLIITLGIAGLLSGIFLASSYIYTKPIIDNNKRQATFNAIFEVLEGCDSVQVLEWKNEKLEISEVDPSVQQVLIFEGFNKEGELVGFAIPAAEPGFQDIIGTMIGYNPDEELIVGLKILESKETPGLGDKIFKDVEFQENFRRLETKPEIVFAKKGEKTKENQIEGITGATISSKAVTSILDNAMKTWKERIKNYQNNEQ